MRRLFVLAGASAVRQTSIRANRVDRPPAEKSNRYARPADWDVANGRGFERLHLIRLDLMNTCKISIDLVEFSCVLRKYTLFTFGKQKMESFATVFFFFMSHCSMAVDQSKAGLADRVNPLLGTD